MLLLPPYRPLLDVHASSPHAYTDLAAEGNNSSNYLVAASSPTLQTGGRDFTVAFWVFGAASVWSTNPTAIGAWASASGNHTSQWAFSSLSNHVYVGFAAGGSRYDINATGLAIPNDTWFLVTIWADLTAQTVSVSLNNGTPVSSSIPASGANDSACQLTFFGQGQISGPPSTFCGCRLDSVGMWARVLSSSERGHLYNNGTGLDWYDIAHSYTSLADAGAWWDCSEATGQNRLDSTGNGNTAVDPLGTVAQVAGIR